MLIPAVTAVVSALAALGGAYVGGETANQGARDLRRVELQSGLQSEGAGHASIGLDIASRCEARQLPTRARARAEVIADSGRR